MDVTVRQKVKGKGTPWGVFINHQGKRKSIKVGSQEAAEALKARIEEKLKAGDLRLDDDRKVPTFGEYARKFLNNTTHPKHSAMVSYDTFLRRHIDPLLEGSNSTPATK
ncbi:MAG: hypothetical protein P8X65_07360 [Syntrophobacterales bacterium]|jgi:hypothetical protein